MADSAGKRGGAKRKKTGDGDKGKKTTAAKDQPPTKKRKTMPKKEPATSVVHGRGHWRHLVTSDWRRAAEHLGLDAETMGDTIRENETSMRESFGDKVDGKCHAVGFWLIATHGVI